MRAASGLQQVDEGLQFRLRKMTELSDMALPHFVRHVGQQSLSGRCDPDFNNSPIPGRTGPPDQFSLFQPIDQPGDIGGTRDEERAES